MAQGKEASTFKYDAFVSYSHAADSELAPVLQQHLQSFAKPWYRMRSLHIFRDDTTLVLTPDLWPDIRKAIDTSRYFVLLASPQAAESRWVQQEVSHWVSTHGARTLLIVLTDGRIEWDDEANDFDWQLTNALPKVLKGVFQNEPKWEDVAALTNPSDLTMQNPVLRKTVASLYAAVTGRPLDEVIGDDVRQHRRTRLIAAATISTILIGSIAGIWREVYFAREREIEQERAEQARQERIRSQSRYVAEQARFYTERGDAGLAINLVLEDLEADADDEGEKPIIPETHFALFGGLHSNLERMILSAGAEARQVAVSAKNQILVAADRSVLIFEHDSKLPRIRLPHDGAVTTASFSRDGERLVSASRDGKARIWTIADKAVKEFAHTDEVLIANFSPDERLLATGSKDDTAVVWDSITGEKRAVLQHESDVLDLAWSADSLKIYTVSQRGRLRSWEASTGRLLFEAEAAGGVRLRSVRVNRDGTRLATAVGSPGTELEFAL